MEVPILTTLLESIFTFYSFLRDGFPAYRPTNDLSLTLVDDINVPKDAQSEWTDGFDNVTSGLTVRNAQAKKMGSADSDSRKISLSFRLCDLPIELALNILCLAGSQSQSTYLSLLLTCRATYKLVPLFVMWLQKNPTLALRIAFGVSGKEANFWTKSKRCTSLGAGLRKSSSLALHHSNRDIRI
ncbi:hypothetical protein LENED_008062 [Lentinula edodes]|uniref:F-box domain-containing protein n=1 Tax=Lentinula edodes TaxID=5353 RepID=A0A1Q3EG71_LENED|nr:hypothetical protein LENED_008062 [Lentinula edodes]